MERVKGRLADLRVRRRHVALRRCGRPVAMSIYRYTKEPYIAGQVRHKAYSFLIDPSGDDDPVWAQRFKDYWELQQETFGVKFSNFTLAIDWESRVIVSFA